MTSRRSPISPTSWVMSSSIHGDSRALTRVHSAVEPRSISRPTRISPSRAASLRSIGIASSRLPSRMSVFVAMSAALATIFSLEKSRKWIIREGRSGISASGAGAPMASGLRKSRGLRMRRDDIDSPVNVWRWYPFGHAPSHARCARRLSRSPRRGSGPSHPRGRAGPVRRLRSPRCATPCPTGRGPRCASRSPARPAWTTWRSRSRAISPGTRSSRSWPWSTAARSGSQAPDLAQVLLSTRPSRAMRAPTVTQATNVLARTPAAAPAACALGPLAVGDLRFALRAGTPPPGFGARSTIVQALAAACGRPGRRRLPRGRRSARAARAVAPADPVSAVPAAPARQPADRVPDAGTGDLPRAGRD